MTGWEYNIVIKTHSEFLRHEELESLGNEGWEMCGVCKNEYSTSFFFKRPAPKDI